MLAPSSSGKPSPSDYLGELVAFGSTLALAWYWNWKASDLVWSLWLSSLCVGYLVLLSQILHEPMRFVRGALSEDHGFSWGQIAFGLVAALAFTVFILAFFTFRFGAFHYGHGFLLEGLFPVEGSSIPRERRTSSASYGFSWLGTTAWSSRVPWSSCGTS